MKAFWYLTVFALVVLASAAVWFGGLNQDEGWYLYAANLVADGQMPYRDFFYTQAPLMPIVYSAFAWIWDAWGLLGARVFTLAIGLSGIVFLVALARRLASPERRTLVTLLAAILLCGNIYHLYFLAIPKTYALASFFVAMGFYLLSFEGALLSAASGVCIAFAFATRISMVALLPIVAMGLLLCRAESARARLDWLWFGLGATVAAAIVFGPFLHGTALSGLLAAQGYHASRGGFEVSLAVGSLSRFVRWYMPVLVVLGIGIYSVCAEKGVKGGCGDSRRTLALVLALVGFACVFAVQMMAPVPYEDYNVPVVGLLAVGAAVLAGNSIEWKHAAIALIALGMTWASSFGSPLIQDWMTNGKDRFWVRTRAESELSQLRKVAGMIEALDPDGKDILTQDLYLAVETGRKVPRALAMGPFSFWDKLPYSGAENVLLDDARMRALLDGAPCRVAAMSGYSFAITAPKCEETPIDLQMEYWHMLKRRYDLVCTEEDFGQGSTPLIVLMRKDSREGDGGSSVQ
jgi:hypothetical protein